MSVRMNDDAREVCCNKNMNPKWHFNPRRPCERMRDSANDAFFTAERLENLSEAVVREAYESSL